jgi:L-iditol 2-dehydrogenase
VIVKAAVFRGPGRLAVEEVSDPELSPDGVIIKVEACGICGSDLRAFQHGLRFARDWQILGHEVAGTVAAVGAYVSDYRIGDRLAIAADVHCGQCYYCQRALYNLCEDWQLVGAHFAGGMAEHMALPAAILRRGIVHRTPDGLSSVHAALAEPASSVLACQSDAEVEPGEVVAVIGGGPMGCLMVQVARARGAKAILAGKHAERLAKARELGAWQVADVEQADPVAAVRALTGGRGADVAVVACASREAQAQAVQMVRKRGRVVLFGGLPKADPIVHLDANRIHYDELRVIGAFSYHPRYHAVALDFIARGQIEAAKIVTASYPLDQAIEAFAAAKSPDALKIVIVP